MTREFYISVDVEADGRCPGLNSMLQLGAVFYDDSGNVLEEFSRNLKPLDGAVQDKETMVWWAEQEKRRPGMWARLTSNQRDPQSVMNDFERTVNRIGQRLSAKPLVVAFPAGFDFTYLYYYLCRFNGGSCVGFSALDLKTLGMALTNRAYHESVKRNYPKQWFNPKLKHTHDALDDARSQGHMFWQMKRALGELWKLVLTDSGKLDIAIESAAK